MAKCTTGLSTRGSHAGWAKLPVDANFSALAVAGRRRHPRGGISSGPAQPKISKIAVNYQDHPDGNKRCDKCIQFQPPDACKVVEGTISPQGSCRIFVAVHA